MTRFFALAIFVFALTAPAGSRADVVYIGISTPGLYELPTEIAQRKGFYRDEGLEVRKVVVRTNLQVAALIAALDRPDSGALSVTQQPLIDLYDSMERQ